QGGDGWSVVGGGELVAADQRPDGAWQIDPEESVGSPAAYGNTLATAVSCRTLRRADPGRFRTQIACADRWLRSKEVHNVFDAAAILLGLNGAMDDAAHAQRRRCLALIRKGQSVEGGWGPCVSAPPGPFETAGGLLAQ